MSVNTRSWLLQEFVGHSTGVCSLALGHKSGRVLATGGENGQVSLWGIENPTCIMSMTGHSNSSAAETVQFNESEEMICVGSRAGTLKIWDVEASKVVRNLTGHKAAVSCIDFHSYGDFIASGSCDNKLKMWDIRRKGCIHTYSGYTGKINSIQFSPDGRWIASASEDKTCKIWDLATGKMLHQFTDHYNSVNSLNFNSSELLLATGSSDKTVKVYDVEQFTNIFTSDKESSAVNKVLFSQEGNIYSASHDICRVYSMKSTKNIDTFIVKWGTPADITVSRGQLIGASFSKNIVSVYVVDLSQVGKAGNVSSQEPQTSQVSQPVATKKLPKSSSSRPFTAPTGEGNVRKFIPEKAKQINHNNNIPEKYLQDENASNVFKPSSTLSRSPPQKDVKGNVYKSVSDTSTASTQRDQSQMHAHRITERKEYPSVPLEGNVPTNITKPAAPVAQIPANGKNTNIYSKVDNEIPTRDVNGADSNSVQKDVPSSSIEPHPFPVPEMPNFDPNDTRLSTLIPSDRKDAIGLDLNAFLPNVKDKQAETVSKELTDDLAISKIKGGSQSVFKVLSSRSHNLDLVRAMWNPDNIMQSISTAIRMQDHAVMIDILGVLNLKTSLWSLDLCKVMLPQIHDLLDSKYESYVITSCTALKIVLKSFGSMIQSNVKSPPTSVVDISREERYNKCVECNRHLLSIKDFLGNKFQTAGKIGSQFREINILLSTLE